LIGKLGEKRLAIHRSTMVAMALGLDTNAFVVEKTLGALRKLQF
jgi:hypothetical protein